MVSGMHPGHFRRAENGSGCTKGLAGWKEKLSAKDIWQLFSPKPRLPVHKLGSANILTYLPGVDYSSLHYISDRLFSHVILVLYYGKACKELKHIKIFQSSFSLFFTNSNLDLSHQAGDILWDLWLKTLATHHHRGLPFLFKKTWKH